MAYKKGMKIGARHLWNYKTQKYTGIKRGNKESFTEVQSKGRSRKAPQGTGMKKGSKLIWGIRGRIRTIRKGNKWIQTTTGIKRQKKYKIPGRRWS